VRLTHLSEAERRAYVIADNKLALSAGWDEMLAIEALLLGDTLEVWLVSLRLARTSTHQTETAAVSWR
jgi:hypothetical protein